MGPQRAASTKTNPSTAMNNRTARAPAGPLFSQDAPRPNARSRFGLGPRPNTSGTSLYLTDAHTRTHHGVVCLCVRGLQRWNLIRREITSQLCVLIGAKGDSLQTAFEHPAFNFNKDHV